MRSGVSERVILANLPHFFHRPEPKLHAPLSLLSLAAVLDPAYEVRIVDLAFEAWQRNRSTVLLPQPAVVQRVVASLARHRSAIVALTAPDFVALTGVLLVSGELKARNPDALVVVGGNAVTSCHRELLEDHAGVDVVVRGEGEETFRELVETVLAGRDWRKIDGLSLRSGATVQVNRDRPLIDRLDSLPLLDYGQPLPVGEYQRDSPSPVASINLETGRGCPFACSFCSTNNFWARRYRTKAPERVAGEMAHYSELYGVQDFELVQDQFCLDSDRADRLCEALARGHRRFSWGCEARAGTLDAALLRDMARVGCRRIKMGVESGSDRVLQRIAKEIDLGLVERTVRLGIANGIRMECSFIIGFPFEEREDMEQTLRFASRLACLGSFTYVNALHPHRNAALTQEYRTMLHPRTEIPSAIRAYYQSDLTSLLERYPTILTDYLSLSSDCVAERTARLLAFDHLTGEDQLFNSLLRTHPYTVQRLIQLGGGSAIALVEALDRFTRQQMQVDLAEIGDGDPIPLITRFVNQAFSPAAREELWFLLQSESDAELAQCLYLEPPPGSDKHLLQQYLGRLLRPGT